MLTIKDVKAQLGVSASSTIYGLIKEHHLAKPLKVGGASRWLQEEIDEFIEKMKAQRDEPPTPTRRGRPPKVKGAQ